jgi:small-conductance mechanosensitive channel
MEQNEAGESFFSNMRTMFEWFPDWTIFTGAVILAILVAVGVHRVFVRNAGRALRDARPFARSLFDKAAGPSRLAFILLAIWLVMPMMPVAGLGDVFGKLFMVAVIGLIGWTAINAAEMSAKHYLQGLDGKTADDPMARTHETQVRVLKRCVELVIVLVTAGFALMTFETGRQIGSSLFGMAALAGLVAAFAAYPILQNLIAGVQIAITQPIRIGDTVEVEGQTGRIADITSSSVVVRLLDRRRLIMPLSSFMEKPFHNVTNGSSDVVGTVSIHANDTVPVERVRQKLTEIVKNDPHWDGRVVHLEVTDAKGGRVEMRAAVSAATLRESWDLRCAVREKLITFLQREHPGALPGRRRPPNAVPGPEPTGASGSSRHLGSRHEAGRTVYERPAQSRPPVPLNRRPPALVGLAERWRFSAIAWMRALFTQAKVWSRAFFTQWSAKPRRSRKSDTGRGVPN